MVIVLLCLINYNVCVIYVPHRNPLLVHVGEVGDWWRLKGGEKKANLALGSVDALVAGALEGRARDRRHLVDHNGRGSLTDLVALCWICAHVHQEVRCDAVVEERRKMQCSASVVVLLI